MSETASVTPGELAARIDALSDHDRKSALHYLAGYAPLAVKIALDEIDELISEARDG